MRFRSIKFVNYRQYKDMELSFPKKGSFDIHIIEAANGTGKTNLLNGMNWCLYGDEPHKANAKQNEVTNDQDSLPLYNIETIEEAKDNGEDVFMVSVTVELEHENNIYAITRKAYYKSATGFQKGFDDLSCAHICNTGEMLYLDAEETNGVIRKLLLKEIREYFYFDGEQLVHYFDVSRRGNIKNNVHTIAQIDILNKVSVHLGDRIKYYKSEIKKNSPELADEEKKYEEAKRTREHIEVLIKNTEEEISLAESEISKANDSINGREQVADKNRQMELNKEILKGYEADLSKLNSELAAIVRDYLIKIFLYKANLSSHEYIEERKKNNTMLPDIKEEDIQESINNCHCKLCGGSLNDSQVKAMLALIEKMRSNSSAQKIAEIAKNVANSLEIKDYMQVKGDKLAEIEDKKNQIATLEERNDKLHREIISYGTGALEDVAQNMEKKRKFEALLKEKIMAKGKHEQQLEDAKKREEKLKAAYDSAVDVAKVGHEYQGYYDFASKAKSIVDSIIYDISEELRLKIAEKTEEFFHSLIWKKNTYGKIALLDNYSLKLYHNYNNKSCMDTCSAGEIELLALAFTLAVHEISKHNSFLLIDTPVARIDNENRRNFAKTLLDISCNKQVILAFTPSEYSKEVSDVFNSGTLSSYTRLSVKDNVVLKG